MKEVIAGNVGTRCQHQKLRPDPIFLEYEPGWFIGKFCKLAFPCGHNDEEYMWVQVQCLATNEGEEIRGVLSNDPLHAEFECGTLIEFSRNEILEVCDSLSNIIDPPFVKDKSMRPEVVYTLTEDVPNPNGNKRLKHTTDCRQMAVWKKGMQFRCEFAVEDTIPEVGDMKVLRLRGLSPHYGSINLYKGIAKEWKPLVDKLVEAPETVGNLLQEAKTDMLEAEEIIAWMVEKGDIEVIALKKAIAELKSKDFESDEMVQFHKRHDLR